VDERLVPVPGADGVDGQVRGVVVGVLVLLAAPGGHRGQDGGVGAARPDGTVVPPQDVSASSPAESAAGRARQTSATSRESLPFRRGGVQPGSSSAGTCSRVLGRGRSRRSSGAGGRRGARGRGRTGTE
jgi:hypothetical protein